MTKSFLLVVLLICVTTGQSATVHAQGTAFTYQGRLSNGNSPLNGSYDLSFTLYTDSSTSVIQAGPVTNTMVVVTNGLFTTRVDFGSGVFVGGTQWLAIAVSPSGANGFALLTPRQQITPTPYALGVVGPVNASQLSGSIPATSIAGVLSLTQLPTGVLTNGSSGVNLSGSFSGTFSGNGAGLTGIPASAIVGLSSLAMAPADMVLIPSGAFTMGNPPILGDTDITETPVSTFVSGFYMDVNLVSWGLWTNVYAYATNHNYNFVNSGAAYLSSKSQPVQAVDWFDCVKWCNARSEQAGLVPVYYSDAGLTTVYRTGEGAVYAEWLTRGYRLPTEAEWEKAARGGRSNQRFPWGNTISRSQANYTATAGNPSYDNGPTGSVGSTTPVGAYPPNGYGLYDMAGNVWQWCWDWYGTPYAGGTDLHGPDSGNHRVFRGGSWADTGAVGVRCAYRYEYDNAPSHSYFNVGFRTVMPAGQ